MDAFLKEGIGYPIRYFASLLGAEQTYLLQKAGSILISWLLGIEPGAWLDTKQARGPRQIGIQSATSGTLVEPQVKCRPSAGHLEPLGDPYPQVIFKFHCPSSLDYRACH